MDKKIKVIVVTGPTATGKTRLTVELARYFDGEIISADSRQVYRGMDIGTGKDLAEYSEGGSPVPCHLINIIEPTESYNLKSFCQDAKDAVFDISERGRLPLFAGGTTMYINALFSGYTLPGGPPDSDLRDSLANKSIDELADILRKSSPESFEDLKDKEHRNRLIRAIEKSRVSSSQVEPLAPFVEPLFIGVFYKREEVRARIAQRLSQRLASGMIEEVECLHRNGVSWEKLEYFGLEYRYIAFYLQKKMSYDEMKEKLLIRIRKFAKSQDVWFRKMEREGRVIHWVEKGSFDKARAIVQTFLDGELLPEPEIMLKNIHYGPQSSKP